MQLTARTTLGGCRPHLHSKHNHTAASLRARAAVAGHKPQQLSTAQRQQPSRSDAHTSTACRAYRGPPLEELPNSLEAALQEMKLIAAPGSSSSNPQAVAAIQAASDALGGMFFLVSCGEYGEAHPRAGQKACGLLHIVFLDMAHDPTSTSDLRVQGYAVAPTLLPFPPPHAAIAYFIVYELDSNGWPTGAAYNTPNAFEVCTTHKRFKKVLASFDIMYLGREVCRLMYYYDHHLQIVGEDGNPRANVPDRQLTRACQDWAHSQLQAAGVKVLVKQDAITLQRAATAAAAAAAARDAEKVEAAAGDGEAARKQAAVATSDGAAARKRTARTPAVPPPVLPPVNRVRRSRPTQG